MSFNSNAMLARVLIAAFAFATATTAVASVRQKFHSVSHYDEVPASTAVRQHFKTSSHQDDNATSTALRQKFNASANHGDNAASANATRAESQRELGQSKAFKSLALRIKAHRLTTSKDHHDAQVNNHHEEVQKIDERNDQQPRGPWWRRISFALAILVMAIVLLLLARKKSANKAAALLNIGPAIDFEAGVCVLHEAGVCVESRTDRAHSAENFAKPTTDGFGLGPFQTKESAIKDIPSMQDSLQDAATWAPSGQGEVWLPPRHNTRHW